MASSESESELIIGIPLDILHLDISATHNLPQKSKSRYKFTYKAFTDWCTKNEIYSFSENVLLAYFGELQKSFKPSSLWSIYSMLRRMLNIEENIDIANYPRLKAFLKIQSGGFKGKKSKTLTGDQIKKYLREAPDWKHLLNKTILIMGISGACRTQEIKNLRMTDVEDLGEKLVINIADTKKKTSRSFVVSGAFYRICKHYIRIRQQLIDPSIAQFFLNYQKGKCTKQVVGINKIGNVPKLIAEYLKLPNSDAYTGHCLSRTSTTILVDAGDDLMSLVVQGSVHNCLNTKIFTANQIVQSVQPKEYEIRTSLPTTSSNRNADSDLEVPINGIQLLLPIKSEPVVSINKLYEPIQKYG